MKKENKYSQLSLIFILKSTSLHFHEATNHGVIRDFHHLFFLHIANKAIIHKFITNAIAQICLHNLRAKENPLSYSSSNPATLVQAS
jgi:hypothetical protein